MSLSVDINAGALKSGNFKDVISVNMKRVPAFPDFVMDWVTRQIEEVVTKLVTLPTLQIILPDFSGIMDNKWNNFTRDSKKAYDEFKAKDQSKQENINSRQSALRASKAGLDCSGKDRIQCMALDLQIAKLSTKKSFSLKNIS